jgi:hypothetical protein
MYIYNGSNTISFTSASTYTQITGASAGQGGPFTSGGALSGFTFSATNGELTAVNAGYYQVTWSLSVSVNSANQEVEGTVFINEAQSDAFASHSEQHDTNEPFVIAGTGVIHLSVGDKVGLGVQNANWSEGTNTVTVAHATLSVVATAPQGETGYTGYTGTSTSLVDYCPQLIQNNYAAAASVSFLYGNQAGNFLLCCIDGGSTEPSAPTDTAGNVWTEVGAGAQSEGSGASKHYIRMYYAYNCLAYGLTGSGATNAVASTNAAHMEIFEFSGVYASGSPYDTSLGVSNQTTSGTSLNINAGALTPTYTDMFFIFGYGASGTLTNGTATVNGLTAIPQSGPPTFYRTGWVAAGNAYLINSATTAVISDNTNGDAYCAITAAFRLAQISNSTAWVGKSNGVSRLYPNANIWNGTLQLMVPVNYEAIGFWYPVLLNINGNWTLEWWVTASGSADTWSLQLNPNLNPRSYEANGGLNSANGWGVVYEMYTSPGTINSINFVSNGAYTLGTWQSTSPVSGNSGHMLHITLAYTASSTNLLYIIHDSTTNGVFSKNYTFNIPSILNSNTTYMQVGANSGGANMTVNVWGLKFIGPSQTVDFSNGFVGLVIPG